MLRNILLVLVVCASTAAFAMGERREKPEPMVGKAAADFERDTLYHGLKKMSDVRRGKKAIMFFWATWCPHCHDQLLRLNNSVDSLKRRGYAVILVDLGEAKNDVKAFLRFNSIFLDSFLDPDSSLQESYRLIGVPTLLYLDEKGVIVSVLHEFAGNIESVYGTNSPKPAR